MLLICKLKSNDKTLYQNFDNFECVVFLDSNLYINNIYFK